MRRRLSLLAGLCLALTIAVPAAANDTVVVNPWRMDEATANIGDTVLLEVGWGACTKGLVLAYTHAARIEWSINDVPFPTTPVWTAPVPVTASGPSTCVNGALTGWRAAAQYPTTFETPGIYSVRVVTWMTHVLPDGGDYDGDGKPDLFSGRWEATVELTIH
jgi:hypothetical protein